MKKRRSELILEAAGERSSAIIASIPESKARRREVAAMISEICDGLVSAKPSRDPTAAEVSDVGKSKHRTFPAAQTMLNHYAELLRTWRGAFSDLLKAGAARAGGPSNGVGAGDDPDEPVLESGADAGTVAAIAFYKGRLAAERLENSQLRKIIADAVPLGPDGSPLPAAPVQEGAGRNLSILRQWAGKVENGMTGFDVGPSGWMVSNRLRLKTVAIPRDVVDALLLACGRVVDYPAGAAT